MAQPHRHRRKARRLALLTVVAALAAAPASAAAGDRYASPTGTGTACTQASPCDLPTAINSAGSGDNIFVPGNQGDYTVSTDLHNANPIHVHGTNGRPTIHMIHDHSPTLEPDSSANNLFISLEGPSFADFGLHGCSCGHRVTVDNVIVHQTTTDHACFAEYSTMTNSVCWAGSDGDLALETDGDNTLRNDTFIGGTEAAIKGFGRIDSCPCTNTLRNVIARSAPGGKDIKAEADSTHTMTFNIKYSNFATTTKTGTTSNDFINGDSTNQTAAPVFVNAANGNFHEKSGSQTIDAGSPAGSCTKQDFDSQPRPDNGEAVCDIGADEFKDKPTPKDTSPPTIKITTPADGAHYTKGSTVNAAYSCSDPDGPSDVKTCRGTVAKGKPIDTSTLGRHSFTVHATDKAGNSRTKTVHYTVDPVQRGCGDDRHLSSSGRCVDNDDGEDDD